MCGDDDYHRTRKHHFIPPSFFTGTLHPAPTALRSSPTPTLVPPAFEKHSIRNSPTYPPDVGRNIGLSSPPHHCTFIQSLAASPPSHSAPPPAPTQLEIAFLHPLTRTPLLATRSSFSGTPDTPAQQFSSVALDSHPAPSFVVVLSSQPPPELSSCFGTLPSLHGKGVGGRPAHRLFVRSALIPSDPQFLHCSVPLSPAAHAIDRMQQGQRRPTRRRAANDIHTHLQADRELPDKARAWHEPLESLAPSHSAAASIDKITGCVDARRAGVSFIAFILAAVLSAHALPISGLTTIPGVEVAAHDVIHGAVDVPLKLVGMAQVPVMLLAVGSSSPRSRHNSHNGRDWEARRHGSGSRHRRELDARRHGSGSHRNSQNGRGLEAHHHGSGSRHRRMVWMLIATGASWMLAAMGLVLANGSRSERALEAVDMVTLTDVMVRRERFCKFNGPLPSVFSLIDRECLSITAVKAAKTLLLTRQAQATRMREHKDRQPP
ncbi:hypothetical protein CPB84DRAFT_1843376 [Gymnopilus junonius]|uniref:Uncharacterized protein n=1 Tax=Gymnopilus junonius TaxID=109634 RepID=A0A9P5NYS5_GYMJU|nr:hypothetical protein CPB84DRAFT_1843376 [Gymnopilus junonius]